MTIFTEGGRTYQVRDCKACEGSGRAPWHIGCGDQPPPECGKCIGIGQYAHELNQSTQGGAK